MIQEYVDGEARPSDRVILEEHVATCSVCAGLLRRHQRAAVEMFETLAPYRLGRNLRDVVCQHLPEFEAPSADVEGINWRAKHPASIWVAFGRLVPAAAIVVLLFLGFVLRYYWPETQSNGAMMGVVTLASGDSMQILADSARRDRAALAAPIRPGERFETGANSAMILALAGPTVVKMNASTRVRLENERLVSVERGEVWLDVGRNGQLFRVKTPSGDVTVFGTAFDVLVQDQMTTVTVQRGDVQVENEISFVSVKPGQRVVVQRAVAPSSPVSVNAGDLAAWADRLVGDAEAQKFYEGQVLAKSARVELRGSQAFNIRTTKANREYAISELVFKWTPDSRRAGHCSYDVYVFSGDGGMKPQFKGRIQGTVFDTEATSFALSVPGDGIRGVRELWIRLVPVFDTGSAEVTFEQASAMGS